MALRFIEISVPSDLAQDVRDVINEVDIGGPWHETLDDGRSLVRLLLEADQTGPIVDQFEKRFGSAFESLIGNCQ